MVDLVFFFVGYCDTKLLGKRHVVLTHTNTMCLGLEGEMLWKCPQVVTHFQSLCRMLV